MRALIGTWIVCGRVGRVGVALAAADARAKHELVAQLDDNALVANDLKLRGRSRALEANITYGVAGGATMAAAVLWLTGAPEARVAIIPQLGAVAGLKLAVRS